MLESVLALTVPFIFVIIIIWLRNGAKHKRNQLQADLYVKALEKGESLPADLFTELKEAKKKRNPLSIGLIWIAIGMGIMLTFLLMSMIANQTPHDRAAEEVAVTIKLFSAMGIVPFFIGVAFVIIHCFEKKKSENEPA